jgi:hypothetical protein
MLAKADEMDAKLVGQNCLVDHVAQDLIHGFQLPVGAKTYVSKCIKTQFYSRHALPPSVTRPHDSPGPRQAKGAIGLIGVPEG